MKLRIMRCLIYVQDRLDTWLWNTKRAKYRFFGLSVYPTLWLDWTVNHWPWCPHDWEIDQCGYEHHQYCIYCRRSKYPILSKLSCKEFEAWKAQNPNTPLK